jgi:hypothetical protein
MRTAVDRLIALAFAAALIAASAVLYATVSQPILESHAFRQAQTALTTYWFLRDGFALAYQTPVVGYPWEIPYELPLFQAIVAAVAALTPYPLESIGRTVSFAFFLATLIPVALICRQLQLGPRVFLVFGTLYLLSPQYLFWGRTFMIESAATFLTVATIAAALVLFMSASVSSWRVLCVVLLAAVAAMVKVTTALPALAVLISVAAALALRHWRHGNGITARTFVKRTLLLCLPVFAAVAWTHFTDEVKAQNEIGKLLTSAALSDWNIGDLRQRMSRELFKDVVWKRSIKANAGGLLGLAALGLFFLKERRRQWLMVGACLVLLFALPLLLFTNLHIVHTYYQSATTIYLLLFLAIALVTVSEHFSGWLFIVLFALILSSSVLHFRQHYWPLASKRIDVSNNSILAAAEPLRERSAVHKPLLIYGLDWSSELPYYAQRKALAVPPWYKELEEPLRNPARYFGTMRPGALVICGSDHIPGAEAVQRFLKEHETFREIAADRCRIYILGNTI